MRRLLLALAFAALAASEAHACQPRQFDQFLAERLNSLPALYARAVTIDRVEIEAPQPDCALPKSRGEITCLVEAEARVVERLKGASPERYSLALPPTDPLTNGYDLDDEMPRTDDGRIGFAVGYPGTAQSIAESGHRSDVFWESPHMAPNGLLWLCGERWGLTPGLPYLVFRDANGLVIAAEPIGGTDDLLLRRLRGARNGAPLMPSKPLNDFFRTAAAITLAKYPTCASRDAAPISFVRTAGTEVQGWLFAIMAYQKEPGTACTVREAVFVTGAFGGGFSFPRRIPVENGVLKLSDIETGFHLVGPSTFTVDQAFAWFKEGGRRQATRDGTVILPPRSPRMIALLLDLANILGGALLAIGLLAMLPKVGDDLRRAADRWGAFGWVVGAVALACGGFYLIVHLISGPRIFHFEVVAIITGVLLLWDRLNMRARTGRDLPASGDAGPGLVLAIFGVIAILVGIQGLFTGN